MPAGQRDQSAAALPQIVDRPNRYVFVDVVIRSDSTRSNEKGCKGAVSETEIARATFSARRIAGTAA